VKYRVGQGFFMRRSECERESEIISQGKKYDEWRTRVRDREK
jgi:hypothetical protein